MVGVAGVGALIANRVDGVGGPEDSEGASVTTFRGSVNIELTCGCNEVCCIFGNTNINKRVVNYINQRYNSQDVLRIYGGKEP